MDHSFVIKKTDIIYVKIVKYAELNYNELISEPDDGRLHKALIKNGILIDLETKEQIMPLSRDENGLVNGTVYQHVSYADYLVKPEGELLPTDDDLVHAANVYEEFLHKKDLYEEKKLLKFPNRRLY